MKLRNKKTGEIVVFGEGFIDLQRIGCKNVGEMLEAGWEDCEEPVEIWYIDWEGDIRSADIDNEWEREKEIGNYFETKEEAEKAVEKLKAWKRLKDKGFIFDIEEWENSPLDEIFYEWNENLYNKEDRKLIINDLRIVFED